jgi:hypothetical protein
VTALKLVVLCPMFSSIVCNEKLVNANFLFFIRPLTGAPLWPAPIGKPVLILWCAPFLQRRDKARQRHVLGVAKGEITTIGAAAEIFGVLLHLEERHFNLRQFGHFTGKR